MIIKIRTKTLPQENIAEKNILDVRTGKTIYREMSDATVNTQAGKGRTMDKSGGGEGPNMHSDVLM